MTLREIIEPELKRIYLGKTITGDECVETSRKFTVHTVSIDHGDPPIEIRFSSKFSDDFFEKSCKTNNYYEDNNSEIAVKEIRYVTNIDEELPKILNEEKI